MATSTKIAPRSSPGLNKEFYRFQPRVQRAWVLFAKRLRGRIDQRKLKRALDSGDPRRVMRLFDDKLLDELLQPLSNILRDAMIRGGRVGEREVK